ncbi:MAG: DUF1013 domain-containing protein [Alphaproteobacteria bacterium]|nr:DUF1013 domain-containing protein [Alphaproteobacteria bacterium]
MAHPLMPKATAVWLVENTALTFRQIAQFCGLHELEVQGIADGEVAIGIKGHDPMASGQLSQEEIDRCLADGSAELKLKISDNPQPLKRTKGPRYVPVSKRQDKPDAIAFLLRYFPELSDPQVCRLIGTTKPTVNAIRERTHWNSSNIRPRDPVTIGLCRQVDLDQAIEKARKAGGKPAAEPVPVAPPAEEPATPSAKIPDWMAGVTVGSQDGSKK